MDADEITKVLAEHRRFWMSAGWIGSPDPSDWRNLAYRCQCNQKIHEASHDEGSVAVAHRAHLATILAPLVEQARQEGARGLVDEYERHWGPTAACDWLRDRAERAAAPGSECACPRGFGGAFRFHRHPCPSAGEVETPGSRTAGGGT